TLRKFGQEAWFGVGDKDLATSIFRSSLLKNGRKLSGITSKISHALGIRVNILPMTDDRFETHIATEHGLIHFQEYLVKRGALDEVLGVEFAGVDSAQPTEGVIEAVLSAERIIVCPSNPIVSIGTILSVKGIKEALRHTQAKKVAVSPIVAGAPIKGPANKLLKGLGLEVSAYSVAKLYADFLDVFVIDVADESEKEKIQALGIEVRVTNTIMRTLADKVSLAKVVLEN
ncbi:MAG: 2-phospho-L-lactate transferase CofD family protein, partial [Chloroflexota bacterium]